MAPGVEGSKPFSHPRSEAGPRRETRPAFVVVGGAACALRARSLVVAFIVRRVSRVRVRTWLRGCGALGKTRWAASSVGRAADS